MLEPFQGILTQELLGNSIQDYAIAVVAFAATFLILSPVKMMILKRLRQWTEQSKTHWDDFLVSVADKNGNWVMWLSALMVGSHFVVFRKELSSLASAIFVIIITFIVLRILLSIITYWFDKIYIVKFQEEPAKVSAMQNMMILFKAGIWLVGVFFILDNLGFNVSTAVAGLGIGGIAVALAAQTVLGDAFSSFSIFFDKPFEVGDFVTVDDYRGTVEHIGIKTTRVRSLTGEQLVFSNSDLTASRLRNFKRMEERRVQFTLGVTYQTSLAQLKKAKELIKEVLDNTEGIRPDRIHFGSYGDYSLNFDVVYYVLNPDYLTYMNINEAVNLSIYEAFEKEQIEFAYPTQTLFVEKNNV
jgi:small-conductance mechanosensitive channel